LLCIVYNKKQMVSKRRTIKSQRRQRQQRGGVGNYMDDQMKKFIDFMTDSEKKELLIKLDELLGQGHSVDDIITIYTTSHGYQDTEKENLIETAVQKYEKLVNLNILKYTFNNIDFYYTISIINSFNTITLYNIDAKPLFFITECENSDKKINKNIIQNVNLDNLLEINVCVTDLRNNGNKYKWNGKSSSGKLSEFFNYISSSPSTSTSTSSTSSSQASLPELDISQIKDDVNKALENVRIKGLEPYIISVSLTAREQSKGGSKSIRRRRQTRMKTRKQYKSRN